jgi:hypothetical protein
MYCNFVFTFTSPYDIYKIPDGVKDNEMLQLPPPQSRSHRKEKAFFQHKKGQRCSRGCLYNWVNGVFYNKSLLVGPQLKVRASFPRRFQHNRISKY